MNTGGTQPDPSSSGPGTSRAGTDDEGPSTREIALQCARIAEDRSGRDVRVLYVGDQLAITEWFVLATVNNRRQARAVRDAIRLGLKEIGAGVPRAHSEDPEGRWSLYDYGWVVLHLFDDEGRDYFDLDQMWRAVPELDLVTGETKNAEDRTS